MAVAAYPATFKYGGVVVNDIMTYDQSMKMAKAETTAFSGSGGAAVGTETSLPTLFSATVKVAGSWNKGDAGQASLETAFLARTIGTLLFTPFGTNTYTAQAWVETVNTKGDLKKQVEGGWDFVITGAITPV